MAQQWHALGALLVVAVATPVRAGEAFAHAEPWDELALARAAAAAGDGVLAAALQQSSRYDALLAIRASVYASAPELLVPRLAALACGRDPDLAPEAAAALRGLVPRVTPSELASREALEADLVRAREALRCEDAPPAEIDAALGLLRSALLP